VLKSPQEGGDEIVYTAGENSNGLTGKYFADHKEKIASEQANSAELQRMMWEHTERVMLEIIQSKKL
jgi:hypothetical protein